MILTQFAQLLSDFSTLEKLVVVLLIFVSANITISCISFSIHKKNGSRMHHLANAIVEITASDIRSEYTCTRCSTPLLEDALYCHRCGAPTEMAYTKKVCNGCHAVLPQDANFCPTCHRRLWLQGGASPLVKKFETEPITKQSHATHV